jgi:threonine dehydratase
MRWITAGWLGGRAPQAFLPKGRKGFIPFGVAGPSEGRATARCFHERQSVTDYVRKILDARVYDVAVQTPLDRMTRLSQRLAGAVFLKREDLQPVFSFKIRGAYNRIARLSPEARAAGVICASAGNHAQGVALSAQRMGIEATVVMPITTPQIKSDAVRYWGGKVVLLGDTFDEAYEHARKLERRHGLTFVHPYDDPDVIAGQGTVGMEILHQHAEPIEAIFVPIGGGGLAAGIASYVKFLRPEIKVIGVEPIDAASMKAAIAAGERVVLDRVGLFADGVAVRQAGAETFLLCRTLLDDVLVADTDEMCAAVKDIFEDTRVIAEPAGALSLAGLKLYAAQSPHRTGALIAINSGANMNFDRLRHVAERAEIGEAREVLLGVTIPEAQGSYRRFVQVLGNRTITEFNYRYAEGAEAHVFVGLKLADAAGEKRQVIAHLADLGYAVLDISANETAKLHVRYMVGGRAPALRDEVILRFEFPERPGALLKFLDGVGSHWNITLFHYRNHGADYGRVLVGLQVPPIDAARFTERLSELGYPYEDETENPAYRMFLNG